MPAFEEIRAMLKDVENAKPVPMTDCPQCGDILKRHPKTKQLHCATCGWIEGLTVDRRTGF